MKKIKKRRGKIIDFVLKEMNKKGFIYDRG